MAIARDGGSAAHTTRVLRVGGRSTTPGGAAGVVGALVLAGADGGLERVVPVPVSGTPVGVPLPVGEPWSAPLPLAVGDAVGGAVGDGVSGPVEDPDDAPLSGDPDDAPLSGDPDDGPPSADPDDGPLSEDPVAAPVAEVADETVPPAPSGVDVQAASRPARTRAASNLRAAFRLERDRRRGRGDGDGDIRTSKP